MSSVIRVTGLTKHFSAPWNRWERFVHNRALAKVTTEEERDEAAPTKAYRH